jgi:hypothetical protein
MTDSQSNFILSLIASRIVPESVASVDLASLTVRDASNLIDTLKAAPYKPRTQNAPLPIAEKGYYRHNGEIYTVVAAKTHDSRSYAKVLVTEGNRGRWDYAKGVVSQLRAQERITINQAKEFGHLHGFCMVCGKTLTDPKSVEQGIGPVCIKRI